MKNQQQKITVTAQEKQCKAVKKIKAILSHHTLIQAGLISATVQIKHHGHLMLLLSVSQDYFIHTANAFNADNVKQWGMLFDRQYDVPQKTQDTQLNIQGWNSSYTRKPIAREQMQEWIEGTMQRINRLSPRRLLEMGCGTGLLLYRYASACQSVHAMDVSTAALSSVRKELTHRGYQHVQLTQGDALNTQALAGHSFDTVVINSVVQYFPGRSYLDAAIDNVLQHTEAGGAIFIGDVRNLDLLTAHIAAIERSRLKQRTPVAVLTERVHRRLQQQKELLISPAFFVRLPERHPQISRVDILVKRGTGDNEMMRYRYDVVLHKACHAPAAQVNQQAIDWIDFNNNIGTLAALQRILNQHKHDMLAVSGIGNARISEDVHFASGLKTWPADSFVNPQQQPGCLTKQAMDNIQALESVLQHAEQRGYHCGLTWSQQHPAQLDIMFNRGKPVPVQARAHYCQRTLTNHPQWTMVKQHLIKQFTAALNECLPPEQALSVHVTLDDVNVTTEQ